MKNFFLRKKRLTHIGGSVFSRTLQRNVVAAIALISVVFSSLTFVSPAQAATITNGSCSATVANSTNVVITQSSGFCYVAFTQVGSNSFTVPAGVTSAELLVIAGGGAGGSAAWGGGGGAGEIAHYTNYSVNSSSSVSVSVGSGGTTGAESLVASANRSTNGVDSWVGSSVGVVARGGGAGASYAYDGGNAGYAQGSSGGSGGGATEFTSAQSGGASTATTSGSKTGYGNSGGASGVANQAGGGGGGSGAVGANSPSFRVGGNGGNGTVAFASWLTAISSQMSSEWQTATASGRIAAGGGGGTYATPGTGGIGGGGAGADWSYTWGSAGKANTGSGGGGSGYYNTPGRGGAGGTGLIIVKFASLAATGNVGSGACAQIVDVTNTVSVTRAGTGQTDCVVKFTSGNNKWVVPSNVSVVRALVVAGGGSGGGGIGGGGGAGELYYFYAHTVTPGNEMVVSIGEGGGAYLGVSGTTGGNTIFGDLIVYGGGGGGVNSDNTPSRPGGPDSSKWWGSAGGGGFSSYAGSGIFSTTNRGGYWDALTFRSGGGMGSNGSGPSATAGGGGGARGSGTQGTASDGGDGGAGYSSDITGTTLFYAGGGGGGVNGNPGLTCACTTSGDPGSGGSGVGGAGGAKDGNGDGVFGDPAYGSPGAVNTGSGGGGGSNTSYGGSGGSGVVILRYTVTNYTVTYNYNGATGGNTTSSSVYVSGDTGLTLPTPTKTGYTFDGWFDNSSFTGTAISGAYTPSQAQTLYAKWVANTYTYTFDSNSGTSVSGGSYSFGQAINLPSNPSKAGKLFAGWSTTETANQGDFSNKIDSWPYSAGAADQTFYAIWVDDNAITFAGTGNASARKGAASTSVNVVPIDRSFTWEAWIYPTGLPGTSATKYGSILDNGDSGDNLGRTWLQIVDSGAGPFLSGGYFDTNGNGSNSQSNANTLTLNRWQHVAMTVTRTGGGEGSCANPTAIYVSIFIDGEKVKETYDTVANGCTSSSGLIVGDNFDDLNQQFMGTIDQVKVWDGALTTAEIAASRKTYATSGVDNVLRAHYDFNDLGSTPALNDAIDNVASSATTYNLNIYAASSALVTSNVTRTQNQFQVTFDGNSPTSGSSTSQSSLMPYTTITAPGVGDLVKTGYSFGGWNTTTTGSGINFLATDSYQSLYGNQTLYANWSANTNTVTYKSNFSGGANDTTQSIVSGTATALTTNPFSRAGWTFNGWNTSADGTGNNYTNGESVTINGALTLFAKWTANNNTVTYKSNFTGGGTDTTQTIVSDSATSLTSNNFTRAGWTFSGWNTAANGSGTNYTNGQSVTLTTGLTLYAKWTADSNTVTFKANYTGAPNDVTQTIVSDTATALSANSFTRTGYTFNGWNTSAAGNATNYSNGETVTLTSGLTLFAKWTANNNTITFKSNYTNGGSDVTQTIVSESLTPLTTNRFTRNGYKFTGWATASNGSGTTYTNNQNVSLTSSETLFAQWTPVSTLGTGPCAQSVENLTGSVTQQGNYCLVAIKSGTAGNWLVPSGVSSISYLVVGGGGGGGNFGGGGAGTFLEVLNSAVTSGSLINATVGTGGSGSNATNAGTSGENSSFNGSIAPGGGGGGTLNGTTLVAPPSTNGSGGGAAAVRTGSNGDSTSGASAGAGIGRKNNGGSAFVSKLGTGYYWSGGGGGGAGAAGQNSSFTTDNVPAISGNPKYALGSSLFGGDGGIGFASSLLNEASAAALNIGQADPSALLNQVFFAGGGGGGVNNDNTVFGNGSYYGLGGLGGGGQGRGGADSRSLALANTGGGGGGGRSISAPNGTGGSGGSGVILISFQIPGISSLTAQAKANSTTEMNLSWTEPSVASSITGYVVEQSVAGANSWSPATMTPDLTSSTGNSTVVSGLTQGTSYDFRVIPVFDTGSGATVSTSAQTTSVTQTVTFKSNFSGGAADTTQTVTSFVSTSLSANAFTRTGYTFGGWNTAADGSGTNYSNNQNVTLSSGLTLFAKWNANNNTVTFKGNFTGSPSDTTQTIVSGIATALTANAFNRTGYTFNGWNTTADGTGTNYSNNQSVTITGGLTLFARWTADNNTVTFKANYSGGPSDITQTIVTDSVTALTSNTFTRTGYTFNGWNTQANGTGTNYSNSQSVTLTGGLTLYAKWTEITYTVTYNVNGASGNPERSVDTYTFTGGAITLPRVASMSKTGYIFGGWSESVNGSAISGAYTPTTNKTLYARWTAASYSITYNSNNPTSGSPSANSDSYTTGGSAVTLATVGSLVKTGYTFNGWSTRINDISTKVLNSGNYTTTAPVILYALWTANSYSVTYSTQNASSGSAPTDTTVFNIGNTVNVKANIGNLTRPGYTFAGWTITSDNTGTVYNSGDTYQVGSTNITFYPKWTANTYNITYNVNGATGSPARASDTYTTGDTAVTLPGRGTMAKTGYTFTGWSTSPTGIGQVTATTLSNVTLYAIWDINSYMYSYYYGAIDGTSLTNAHVATMPTGNSVLFNQTFNLASTGNNPTNVSPTVTFNSNLYQFFGWNDGNTTYNAGSSIVMGNADKSYTAQWIRLYAVRYSLNGGTGIVSTDEQCTQTDNTCTPNQNITLSSAPVRTGYTFDGWEDQTGVDYSAGAPFTVTNTSYLLYAKWTAIDYTISFDSSGGSVTIPSTSKNISQSVVFPSPGTRTGYDFSGWTRTGDINGTIYGVGTSFVVGSSNVEFVATWTPHRYTVSYNWNGGVGANEPPVVYTVGTSALTLPSSNGHSRDGYIFDGWATSDGGVKIVGSFTPSQDIMLFARWIDGSFDLTFNATGGSLSQSNASVSRTSSMVLPTPTRSGFQFQGWFTDVATTYIYGQGGETVTPSASRTLYAKWVQNSLAGINPAHLNPLTTLNIQSGTSGTWTGTHTSSGTGAALNIPANTLPAGTAVTVSFVEDLSRPASLIDNNYAYFTSVVVHWLLGNGSSASVPEANPGSPLTLTLTNPSIVAGAKVFKIINGSATEIATAAIDGEVVLTFTEDPEFVIAATRPSAPRLVSATDGEDGSSTVSWTAPAGNGGSIISGYTVTATPGGSICTSSGTTCSFTGLSNGTSYTFSVAAVNAIGTSSSAVSPAITPRAAIVVQPQNPVTNSPTSPSLSQTTTTTENSQGTLALVTPAKDSSPTATTAPSANPRKESDPLSEEDSDSNVSQESGRYFALLTLVGTLAAFMAVIIAVRRRRKRG